MWMFDDTRQLDEWEWLTYIIVYPERVDAPFIYENITRKHFIRWIKELIDISIKNLSSVGKEDKYYKDICEQLLSNGSMSTDPVAILGYFYECISDGCAGNCALSKDAELIIEADVLHHSVSFNWNEFNEIRKGKYMLKKENKNGKK